MKKKIVPVNFSEANADVHCPGDQRFMDVLIFNESNTSCWKLPFWKRVKVLFFGKIYITLNGEEPPMFLDTYRWFKNVKGENQNEND